VSDLGEVIALAIIQGITEFLPISSDGHLLAWKILTGSEHTADLTLVVLLHAATLLPILFVYRRDFARVLAGAWRGGTARRELAMVVLGTIPAGIAGLLWHDEIERLPAMSPYVLPICWAGMAVVLLGARGAPRPEQPIDARRALWIGCWQALALLPGVSRSGITIVAALWVGIGRTEAARYSFLVGAPLMAGAVLYEIYRGVDARDVGGASFLIGFLVALAVGMGALLLLLRLLRAGRLHWFGYYLLAAAGALTLWLRCAGGE
jgi:undecaprenyl-diphosphatase